MYFILSSLLSFVCNPVFYIIVCLVLAWLVKNRIVKKSFIWREHCSCYIVY